MAEITFPRALLAAPVAGILFSISILGATEWETAEPGAVAMDSKQLQAAIGWLKANSGPDGVGQLVIVRRGRVVHRGRRAQEVHGVWSVTKSFTSTVLGLLVEDGRCRLDDPVASYDPALAVHYSGLTLRHFKLAPSLSKSAIAEVQALRVAETLLELPGSSQEEVADGAIRAAMSRIWSPSMRARRSTFRYSGFRS